MSRKPTVQSFAIDWMLFFVCKELFYKISNIILKHSVWKMFKVFNDNCVICFHLHFNAVSSTMYYVLFVCQRQIHQILRQECNSFASKTFEVDYVWSHLIFAISTSLTTDKKLMSWQSYRVRSANQKTKICDKNEFSHHFPRFSHYWYTNS